jgi:hypothetical protein
VKSILFFLLFISLNISAQVYHITNSSFEINQPIERGSLQYVDIGNVSNVTLQSRFVLTIFHLHLSPISLVCIDTLINENFKDYTDTILTDVNGNFRVYFEMPSQFYYNNFDVVVGWQDSQWAAGVFTNNNIASTVELSQSATSKVYTYTNLLGQSTLDLKGLLIRSDKRLIYFE